ncbi:DUF5825 family protein [Streptomyces polygonati]|uniref:DUF5825 family protein n=1 Tax=Streptomyces polygonati TaxID=1617087 RepID=A0ABV8HRI3_9ACTN
MTTATQDQGADIALVHRRHADPATITLEGMGARAATLGADPIGAVSALWEQGARHVVLPEPVDLSAAGDGERAVRALVALRELTSRAIAVEWRLHLGGDAEAVTPFRHLAPPQAVTGVPDAAGLLDQWRTDYFFGACVFRRGPGFLQVRDKRDGQLSRITIDEADFIAAVDALEAGAPADAVSAGIVGDLAAEGLVGRAGAHVWWTPCRVLRWPTPAMLF